MYIYIIYIYIYIYIYILCFLFIVRLSHWFHIPIIFPAVFTWSLSLVETAYQIVNMTEVIHKKGQFTNDEVLMVSNITLKNCRRWCFIENIVFENFAIFIRKHLTGLQVWNFIKRRLSTGVFP